MPRHPVPQSDDDPDDSPTIRLPHIDWSAVAAAVAIVVSAAAWALALTADISDYLTAAHDNGPILLTIFAAFATVVSILLCTSYGKRRLMNAHARSLRCLIAERQQETVEHLAAIARELEQVGATALGRTRELVTYVGEVAATQTELAAHVERLWETVRQRDSRDEAEGVPGGADDQTARAAVSAAFETGRRIGQRQAARAMNGAGSPAS